MTPARAQVVRTGGLAIALVFVLAGGLRLWQLGREGVWCDEGYTANMIREPFAGMVHSGFRRTGGFRIEQRHGV